MIRIAYLTSEYPAPSHTFIRREIAALRRRGLSIVPFSVRRGSIDIGEDIASILGSRGLVFAARAAHALLRSPFRALATISLAQRHRVPGIRGWLWAQFHVAEALALTSMLRAAKVEHLHSHFANSGATVGMLAAHYLRMPWSLSLHGISETDFPAGVLLPEKLKRARFVACASWFMRAQAMRLVPTGSWSKFHIVRCGVELPERFHSNSGNAAGTVRFIAVGRASSEKGFPGLVQAITDVVAAGIDARLVIVGDGPLRGEIERQIDAAGLGERVSMLGSLSESRTLAEIRESDILVLPSLMEGLPVVLIEAMALGKPVIATCIAGIPELITHGETGLLFRPADWTQLSRRMLKLARDSRLRQHLGTRARAVVEREFEIDIAVAPLATLFGRERL